MFQEENPAWLRSADAYRPPVRNFRTGSSGGAGAGQELIHTPRTPPPRQIYRERRLPREAPGQRSPAGGGGTGGTPGRYRWYRRNPWAVPEKPPPVGDALLQQDLVRSPPSAGSPVAGRRTVSLFRPRGLVQGFPQTPPAYRPAWGCRVVNMPLERQILRKKWSKCSS